MKRKIGLGIIIFLLNLGFGVVSFRVYQDLTGRISDIEVNQKIYFEEKIYLEGRQKMYDVGLKKWESDHDKTIAELLKIIGIDDQYDFNNALVNKESLKKFFNHRVYAKTSLLLEVSEEMREMIPDTPKEVKKGGESSAIVIGRYVLMASHTNDPESFNKKVFRFPMPNGVIEVHFELKVLEHKVTILLPNGKEAILKEIYRSREKDFSLFEMPLSLRALNFPFKFGESVKLKMGNFVYMNGQPGGINLEVARPGYVTVLTNFVKKDGELIKSYNEFGLSQATDSGDSGSPIIAFKDGKPELVGIYLGWVEVGNDNGRNTRSRALKIDTAVDEIKEKLGVDLRKLQRQVILSH